MFKEFRKLIDPLIISFFPLLKFQIVGKSMFPTFDIGDEVLVNRLSYFFSQPKIDDIVACKDPRDGRILIKRIKQIDNGKYFLVGDNKEKSTDSRKFGMLERGEIIGKVVYHNDVGIRN